MIQYYVEEYKTPQIEICECEQDDILTASIDDVLVDDRTWGEIS